MNKGYILRCFLCFIAPFCSDVELRAQSMQEIIEIAKNQSLDAQIANKTFSHSELVYRYYQADRKPSLTFTTIPVQYSSDAVQRYSYEEDKTYYRTQNSLFSTANLRLQQNVDFLGGYFYVDSDLKYYKSFGSNSLKQFTTVPLRLGYSQNLIGYNNFKWLKKIEPFAFHIAEKTLLYKLEQVAIEALTRYFTVALLAEEQKQAEEHFQNCDTLYKVGLKKKELGKITERNLYELHLEVSKARNKLMQAEMDLKIENSLLNKFLHFSEKDSIKIIVPSDETPTLSIPLGKAIEYAKENSVEILSSEKNVLESRQKVEQQRISRYFDATINASVGLHQISEEFRDAYKNPLNEQVVSVGVSIPIANFGRRKAKHLQAVVSLENSMLSAEKTQENITNEITSLVLKLPIQRDIIHNTKETYNLSNILYEEVLAQYKVGRWDFNSLNNAIANRRNALINYYSALKDFWTTYYKIRSLTLYDFENDFPIVHKR